MNDAAIDEALRSMMSARPTPAPMVDLAAVAMERARVAAVQRVRRWTTVCTAIAAALAVAVVVAVVRARWASGGFASWGEGSISGGSSNASWMVIGVALAMGAVTLVAVRSAWDGRDEWVVAR